MRGERVLVGVAGLLLGASPAPVQALPGRTAAGTIDCSQAADRIEITADAELDPSCTYTGGFDITASNVTLDCNGALVQDIAAVRIGILIHAPAAAGQHDVTVTDCRVDGFLNNLRVTRDGAKDLAPGNEYDTPTEAIVITRSDFRNSRGVGLYVDAYVSDVTITDSEFHDTGSSGIYLETGSNGNHIEGNSLVHNGYRENGAQGQTFEVGGTTVWYWGTGREGISVDSSYDNAIRNNHFERNSFGGVLLYENCGENQGKPGWFERRWPASSNLIEANSFEDEHVGVWIGSRMGENTLPMDCSDPAYVERPGLRVALDHAPDNTVRNNTFDSVTYGVRVEDDGAVVEGNAFTAGSPDHHAIIVGTPYRTDVLGQPVLDTVLRDNRSTIAGNDSPYRWVHGHDLTSETDNTAFGEASALCEGEPPPRQLFVMVIAVAGALPDGSKPPTPDLTMPVLGALPSCRSAPPASTTTGPPPRPAQPAATPATAVTGTPTYTG
jgi:parallel beta-helix repeat protein